MFNFKKALTLIVIVFAAFILCSCNNSNIPNRNSIYEIENYTFVRSIGVDKNASDYILTTISEYPFAVSPDSEGTKTPYILSQSAQTLIEAQKKMLTYAYKNVGFSHVDSLIVGEVAAKEDISQCIDMLTRSNKTRADINLYVVKSGSAKEMIETTNNPNSLFFDKLQSLTKDTKLHSYSSAVTQTNFIKMLSNPYSQAFLPYIEFEDNSHEYEAQKNDIKLFSIKGYAVFNNNKLSGYLSSDQSLGLNFLINQVGLANITVDYDDAQITLEIDDSVCDIIPKLENNQLSVEIKIRAKSNLTSIEGYADNVFSKQGIDKLILEQNKAIENYITQTIEYSKATGLDFFGINTVVMRKYPKYFNEVKSDWPNQLKNITFTYDVKSQVLRTYMIKQPIQKD